MSAFYDWSVVGYSSHPIGGDPSVVTSVARQFSRTADDIRNATTAIQRIENGDNEALFLHKALEDAREIAAVLWQALGRYETAAEALTTFAAVQLQAKQQAEAALRAAVEARAAHQRAADRADQIRHLYGQSTDPAQREQLKANFYYAQGDATSAEANFRKAEALIRDAVEDRNRAGNVAASQIRDAINDKELNDSLADRFNEIVSTVIAIHNAIAGAVLSALKAIGKWIWDHLDVISLVLTILAVALAWVPVLGQILGGAALLAKLAVAMRVVATVSKVVSVASKVVDVAQRAKLLVDLAGGVSKGLRTGDWTHVGPAFTAFALGSASKLGFAKLANMGAAKSIAKTGVTTLEQPRRVQAWASWAVGIGKRPGSMAYDTDNIISTLKHAGQPHWLATAESIKAITDVDHFLTDDLVKDMKRDQFGPFSPGFQRVLTQPVPVPAAGGGGGW